MPFLIVVVLSVAFELLFPFALIAFGLAVLRPRRTAGVRASGAGGAAAGAALFVLVVVAKSVLTSLGVPSLWEGRGAIGEAAGEAAFVAIAEETVRFLAALLLFRHAKGHALRAAFFFGVGWGGIECFYVGVRGFLEFSRTLAEQDPSSIPLPWLPLVGVVERVSAMSLHLALTAWAVQAARGRAASWTGWFVAALAAHFALDALVVWYGAPALRALASADYIRGLRWLLTMECWFLAGSLACLSFAFWITSGRGSRGPAA